MVMKGNVKNNYHSLDLLKILAAFMVIAAHAAMYTKANFVSSVLYNKSFFGFLIKCISTIGNTADMIFIIISAWFISNSNKNNYHKIITLLLDVLIISVISLSVAVLFLNKSFSLIEIKKYLFPNIYGECWYITCYIIVYLAHPLLNDIINKYSIKRVIIPAVIYYLVNLFFSTDALSFNEITYFISVYFFIFFYKTYMFNVKNKNKYLLLLFLTTAIYFCLFYILYIYSYNYVLASSLLYKLSNIYSPFHLFAALLAFSYFYCIRINCSVISKLSKLTGLLFIFHVFCSKIGLFDDIIIRITNIKNINYISWYLLLFIILINILLILSYTYSITIQKITNKLSTIFLMRLNTNDKKNSIN